MFGSNKRGTKATRNASGKAGKMGTASKKASENVAGITQDSVIPCRHAGLSPVSPSRREAATMSDSGIGWNRVQIE
jgi:hypothetical protein